MSESVNAERETCPSCGYEDDRDAFEGWEGTRRDAAHGRGRFVVRCPRCEALHPDQSDHDAFPDPIPNQEGGRVARP